MKIVLISQIARKDALRTAYSKVVLILEILLNKCFKVTTFLKKEEILQDCYVCNGVEADLITFWSFF